MPTASMHTSGPPGPPGCPPNISRSRAGTLASVAPGLGRGGGGWGWCLAARARRGAGAQGRARFGCSCCSATAPCTLRPPMGQSGRHLRRSRSPGRAGGRPRGPGGTGRVRSGPRVPRPAPGSSAPSACPLREVAGRHRQRRLVHGSAGAAAALLAWPAWERTSACAANAGASPSCCFVCRQLAGSAPGPAPQMATASPCATSPSSQPCQAVERMSPCAHQRKRERESGRVRKIGCTARAGCTASAWHAMAGGGQDVSLQGAGGRFGGSRAHPNGWRLAGACRQLPAALWRGIALARSTSSSPGRRAHLPGKLKLPLEPPPPSMLSTNTVPHCSCGLNRPLVPLTRNTSFSSGSSGDTLRQAVSAVTGGGGRRAGRRAG